jgi:predicted dehydrogenase
MTCSQTRRDFLIRSGKTAAVTAAATRLGPVHSQAAVTGSEIQIGIIGCGGIMKQHVQRLVEQQSAVSLPWICDIDPRQMDTISRTITNARSAAPKRTSHYEDVISDRQIDAVVVATPHHWHAPIALAALAAGKDVYLEKPISHVYNEGPLLVAAAKKHGRVLQQGTQMRSSPVTAQAGRLLADGIIGEVKVARAWTAETRKVLRPVPDSKVPAGVDYNRWLGPAPSRPFNAIRFHNRWRLFRDYGNGEIGDDGIHDLDMARWGLGDPHLPKYVTGRGGRMSLHGHVSEYPDNLNISYEYPDGRLLIYENYPFTAYGLHGFDNGNAFYGTEGYMIFSRRGAFNVFLGPKGKPGPTEKKSTRRNRGYVEHMQNFLEAIRKGTSLNASPEIAHASCALVHLGEIATVSGRSLEFDPQTERFINAPQANAMLTKQYRKPFELPTSV